MKIYSEINIIQEKRNQKVKILKAEREQKRKKNII